MIPVDPGTWRWHGGCSYFTRSPPSEVAMPSPYLPPRSIRLGLAALLAATLAACSSGPKHDGPTVGSESFTSQAPGGGGRTGPVSGDGSTAVGAPAPSPAPGAPSASPGAAEVPRTIEEADIYARLGTSLLVLNAYRGLQVVDLSDPAAPRLIGRVPVLGTPVDLYVRGTTAFVLVSDAFAYVLAADGSTRPTRGSRLVAVDVSNPAAPAVIGELAIDGQVEESRLVGDVLYAVSRRWWWYDWVGPVALGGGAGIATTPGTAALPVPGQDTVFVASFDLTDPAHPAPVDRLELAASGWDIHANVTSERITLSFAGWQAGPTGAWGLNTTFLVVDSSDPAGALAAGTSFGITGQVRDRWGMDFDGATGLFRAVSDLGNNSGAALDTWRSPSPTEVTPLSRLVVPVQESLTAARFDGARVYLVTALRIDPLWVVDGTDPAAPFVAGELTMPGQLDFIEPRGDRLVALGHTDEAGQPWQLAASLIDVADLSAPVLLSRVTFGSGYGSVNASADDLRKAFLVFDPPPAGIGLVLVPLLGWDPATWAYAGGTQLLDLGRDALTLRGFLAHPGAPSRAFPIDAAGSRLVAFSDAALQVIDASDRSAPAELARLDLARSVTAVAPVNGKLVQLSGDWYRGDTELVVTEQADPDAAVPLARVHVPAPASRMFQVGSVTWLLARDWSTGRGWLQAVDLTDPLHPVKRGTLELAGDEAVGYGPGWWGYGDEAALVGSVLAVHRFTYVTCVAAPCLPIDELRFYDLTDPDHPVRRASLAIPGGAWSWGLTASGNFLWLTHFEWGDALALPAAGGPWGRYYVDRVDLTDPSNPVLLPKINVPGVLAAASPDGRQLTTLETRWSADTTSTWVHGLDLTDRGTASLRGSVELPGYPAGSAQQGGTTWILTSSWAAGASSLKLAAVDLASMTLASSQQVQGGWAWLQEAAGGKLFLQAGWNDQGILVYDLADPGQPAFHGFHRTSGWVQDVVVGDGVAWLPSGPYGVQVIDLTP